MDDGQAVSRSPGGNGRNPVIRSRGYTTNEAPSVTRAFFSDRHIAVDAAGRRRTEMNNAPTIVAVARRPVVGLTVPVPAGLSHKCMEHVVVAGVIRAHAAGVPRLERIH